MSAAAGSSRLVPVTSAALDDLASFLERAVRADAGGAVRLQVLGGRAGAGAEPRPVLAVTVAPLTAGARPPVRLPGQPELPTVLGMRFVALALAGDDPPLDATVPVRGVLDRLARSREGLSVPPERVVGASWAGLSPPRSDWSTSGTVGPGALVEAASRGADHVAGGQARGTVWSAELPGTGGAPSGTAFVAHVLGFLPDAASSGSDVTTDVGPDDLVVLRSGSWWRLVTPGGHVVARRPVSLTL